LCNAITRAKFKELHEAGLRVEVQKEGENQDVPGMLEQGMD